MRNRDVNYVVESSRGLQVALLDEGVLASRHTALSEISRELASPLGLCRLQSYATRGSPLVRRERTKQLHEVAELVIAQNKHRVPRALHLPHSRRRREGLDAAVDPAFEG